MHGVESALSRLHNGNLSDSDLFVMDAGLREPGVRDVIDAITDLMPGVPVIVLEDSGYDGAAAETLAKQVILLEKPLTFEQLARATRKALDAT
jgi:DNA-binding NtrC family response regulator